MGAAAPPLASLVKGTVNLGGLADLEEGWDHGPLQLCHRAPEYLSEGGTESEEGTSTHDSGDNNPGRTRDGIVSVQRGRVTVRSVPGGVFRVRDSIVFGGLEKSLVISWIDEGATTYG